MTDQTPSLKTWISGLAQLRWPALVRLLGELRMEAEELERVRRNNPGAKIERGVVFRGRVLEQLAVGRGATVSKGTILSCADSPQGAGRIAIGEGTWLGQYNNLRTSPESSIEIGRDCLISQFCTLVSANHGMQAGTPVKDQPMDTRRLGIVLGDDVWLGAGVTVLPGVRIGSGSVVGAGSVVTRDVPPGEIWTGVPAQRQGSRS